MLSWHVCRASGRRRAWSENLMGTGARANSWQHRATSPGATHTLAEWETAFITSRQGCNNCFLLQFPSTGPSCSASTENPEPTAGKQQDGQDMWLLHRDGADLSPQVPLSLCPTQGPAEGTLPSLGFLQSSHVPRRPAGLSSAHARASQRKEPHFCRMTLFSKQKCQDEMRHQKLDSKKKPISWWQRYKACRPTTASSSKGWLGCIPSPLCSFQGT